MAELERASVVRPLHLRVLRALFLAVVIPTALIVLVFVAYSIVYIGIEHY